MTNCITLAEMGSDWSALLYTETPAEADEK
jgi:hypothetical protein